MKVAILGAGPGGYVAALRAAQFGAQVTVIEQSEVGGTCLNWGCIPTKALLASAEVLRKIRNIEDYGVDLTGSFSPNLARMMERKDKIVLTQVRGIRALFKSWGVTLIRGRGSLSGPRTVEVQEQEGKNVSVEADKIIIATGSRPARIPRFPFDGERILSSDDALRLQEIPRSLLIVGAGVIGCEFASLFTELGTEVVMVEMLPHALATEDEEVSALIEREFKKRKIKLLTSTSVAELDILSSGVRAILSDGSETTIEKVLVSVGRELNTEGIGLEGLGIIMGKRGEVPVDSRMETNVRGIYAVGDITGGMLLAHKASREGIVAASNACGKEEEMDYSVLPAAIFTSPEVASVGLREQQAAEMGLGIRKGLFHFRAVGKAHAIGEVAGFCKIIADDRTERILGAHIVGPHAADLIHEMALAMHSGLTVSDVSGTIHVHPTLSEVVLEAAEDLRGQAIHALRR